ncbi:thaumatin-like protein [Coprinopsis sp. MPI-PUGE-AT-0042]|nr:thaumatin-like protein [Coprinopsis sp. MPI-PUGE-AT-0042]
MLKSLSAATFLMAVGASARIITVYNACPFTIWPAMFTGVGARPNYPTGWEARSFTKVDITVPDNWTAGRIWARRNCNFSNGATGPNTCISGGCNGGLQCTNPGVPPVSLAEFTLNASGNKDFYDVSLVDGLTTTGACPVAECPVDLGPDCPGPLRGPFDNTGFPLGCKSACIANLDGNPANSRNCCSGQFNTPQTCPRSGVAYYDYFKGRCPNSYAYAYDESSGNALFTCPASSFADYTITFCP